MIVQNLRPDRFFSTSQQRQLATLMGRWRAARDQGAALLPEELAELRELVDAELRASAARGETLADELGR